MLAGQNPRLAGLLSNDIRKCAAGDTKIASSKLGSNSRLLAPIKSVESRLLRMGGIMTWVFVMLAFTAGMSVALQPLVNARAAAEMGHPLWGAFASATATFLVLIVAMAFLRLRLPNASTFQGFPPWWLYGGGLIGALMLFSALLAAPRLGIAATVALIIAGQLTASMILDHFALLGVPRHSIGIPRLLGAGFLLAGAVLVGRY
jgi:transporter family-2 protein